MAIEATKKSVIKHHEDRNKYPASFFVVANLELFVDISSTGSSNSTGSIEMITLWKMLLNLISKFPSERKQNKELEQAKFVGKGGDINYYVSMQYFVNSKEKYTQ